MANEHNHSNEFQYSWIAKLQAGTINYSSLEKEMPVNEFKMYSDAGYRNDGSFRECAVNETE